MGRSPHIPAFSFSAARLLSSLTLAWLLDNQLPANSLWWAGQ